MSSDSLLLDSGFKITDVNQEKYDRVARITGVREDLKFTLDINCEIYPISVGEEVQLSLATTLSLDGSVTTKADEAARGGWRESRSGEATLADAYDYVCYGKVYKFEEGEDDTMRCFVSFGGLLLYVEGPYKRLSGLKHEYIYLLMKK